MYPAHGKFWFRSLCLTEVGEGPSYQRSLPVLGRSHPLPKKQQIASLAASALGTWWWAASPQHLCAFPLCPCPAGPKRAQEQTSKCGSWNWLRVMPVVPLHMHHAQSARGGNGSAVPPQLHWSSATHFSITEFLWQLANWQHEDKKKDFYEVYQVLVGQTKSSSS